MVFREDGLELELAFESSTFASFVETGVIVIEALVGDLGDAIGDLMFLAFP